MQKTILITGISSGIGRYLAEHLSNTTNIIGIGRNDPQLPGVVFFPCDLSDQKEILLTTEILKKYSLDGIILNAGIGCIEAFEKTSFHTIQQILRVNLEANILLCHRLLPFWKKDATLIAMGSKASTKFMRYSAAYQASKFGLRGFIGALKQEYPNLAIHLLHPSIVETNFFSPNEWQYVKHYEQTSLTSIFETIQSILEKKEKSFEIFLPKTTKKSEEK